MDQSLNPASRPRRGVAIGLVAALCAGIVAIAVVAQPEQAEASGLERFTSCEELSAWGEEATARMSGGLEVFEEVGEPISSTAPAPQAEVAADATGSTAGAGAGGDGAGETGATNVIVEGVDELDLIDRLGGDVVLVSASGRLAIVDLAAGERLASVEVPFDAQVTYDADAGVAWAVGSAGDGSGVEVRRISVGDGTLEPAGAWSTRGMLVDARRVGDELHVVASDGFVGIAEQTLPFEDGPVPCDEVLHPVGPSDPTATLLVTLPATGDLEPLAATEVVGSGQLVHVTTDAAYLATPQWEGAEPSTTIHRFELDDLTHTGSGRVPGTLLNDFSMSDHEGHLRVAVTAATGPVVGMPMPVDDMVDPPLTGTMMPTVEGDAPVASGGGTAGSEGSASGEGVAPETIVPEPPETSVPETSVPDTTVPETTVPETTVPETTTTTEAPTTTTSTSTTTTTVVPGATIPGPAEGEPFNSVVVLDTEGDLDVVGHTGWFGHPGETLHGIRFVGDVAYAVTFLQTDPFYVLDLASPTAPRVAGEVELPGFSAYLHPLGDGRVVGFGPGEDGRAAAKLFDVSDPTAPEVLDTVVLGDESPVVYDHHAFVDLGDGRFAVPVTTWPVYATICEPTPTGECLAPDAQMSSSVVTMELAGGRLAEVDRTTAETPEPASRALPVGEGWALLAGPQIVLVDADGAERATVDLAA